MTQQYFLQTSISPLFILDCVALCLLLICLTCGSTFDFFHFIDIFLKNEVFRVQLFNLLQFKLYECHWLFSLLYVAHGTAPHLISPSQQITSNKSVSVHYNCNGVRVDIIKGMFHMKIITYHNAQFCLLICPITFFVEIMRLHLSVATPGKF